MKKSSTRILGVPFFTAGNELLPLLEKKGGLVVVPSGPGLALDLIHIPTYRKALVEADFVIPDSGFMVILWNAIHCLKPSQWISRYSGLELVRDLVQFPALRAPGATFWVMPSEQELAVNVEWLRNQALPEVTADDCYAAPYYRASLSPDGKVEDPILLEKIKQKRPKYIFVNIGSGVQEQLGYYLKENLTHAPAIICTGAAIAFLTGQQAKIPPWADYCYMGWMFRVLREPKRFGPRYGRALKLLPLMLRYKNELPPPVF